MSEPSSAQVTVTTDERPSGVVVVVVGVVVGVVVVGVVAGVVSVEAALSAAAVGPAIAAATAIAAAETVAAFVERPTSSSYTAIEPGKHAIGVNILFYRVRL